MPTVSPRVRASSVENSFFIVLAYADVEGCKGVKSNSFI
jgi:hypothetical protein